MKKNLKAIIRCKYFRNQSSNDIQKTHEKIVNMLQLIYEICGAITFSYFGESSFLVFRSVCDMIETQNIYKARFLSHSGTVFY